MKRLLSLSTLSAFLFLASWGCGNTKGAVETSPDEAEIFGIQQEDTVEIADKASNYDIVIIEPGFQTWLQSIARPEGYYSQS